MVFYKNLYLCLHIAFLFLNMASVRIILCIISFCTYRSIPWHKHNALLDLVCLLPRIHNTGIDQKGERRHVSAYLCVCVRFGVMDEVLNDGKEKHMKSGNF